MTARVLLVDDDPAMLAWLKDELTARATTTLTATSPGEALAILAREDLDVVVTDLAMPRASGIALCADLRARFPEVPAIVLTAFGSLESAVEAIRAGAYDFLTKPVEIEALVIAIDRAVERRSLRREVKRLHEAIAPRAEFEELVGASGPMRALYDVLERVAESDATVLVTGETGTGKEVVARAIHRRSARKRGPFVALSCAALPEHLLEAELFGHTKGAFTDARAARPGIFVEANGGTLFLDEIGELAAALQPKLLRALEERKVRPIGGGAEVAFDVHLVAATNRDLEALVEEKRFRKDLYYRLDVIHVELPALRERGGDVLVLARHFLRRFAARAGKEIDVIDEHAAEKLLSYSWPGNVRELSNCVERAVALSRSTTISTSDLPPKVRDHQPSQVVLASDDPGEMPPLEDVERRYILRVLESVRGNKMRAARILGLDRKTLYRKLERWGVKSDDDT